MDVEGVDGDGGVALEEAVEVDVGDDVARGATIGEAEDAFEVALDGDRGFREPVERRRAVARRGGCGGAAEEEGVVALRDAVEEGGEDGDDAGDRVGVLHQLRH